MINKLFQLILIFIFCANFSLNAQKVIYVLSLGDVSSDVTKVIQNAVFKFYGYQCVVKPKVPFTKDILADSKTRYEASRILAKYKSNENLLIITDKDIAIKKGNIKEYGIFGLGYRPGSTCVISTFRIKKNVSLFVFNERLKKICLHEIGHNLGLNHCTSGNSKCMMNDAKGTIKQVDREEIYFCNTCLRLLGK